MNYFVHDRGICEAMVGEETRIWAYAHVMEGAIVGSRCNIGEHCFIEKGAVVGNDCVIKNGVALWDGVIIKDSVFIGPNACFTNDLLPRTKSINPHFEPKPTCIESGVSIGANSTIVCGIQIGEYALIGAGSVVTKDVPAFALVYGNPAVKHGWISKLGNKLLFDSDYKTIDEDGSKYQLRNDKVILL